ncbi:MAG: phage tail sheath C-terminal domain-containing protein [Bacteroidota bacterium]
MAEIVLPGTYIKVFDEGLISAGAVASGNIGIVGTANKGPLSEVQIISSFSEARAIFGDTGEWDPKSSNNLTLVRSLELIFNNGGRTIYAVRVATGSATHAKVDLSKGNTKYLSLKARTEGKNGESISVELVKSAESQFIVTDGQTVEKYDLSETGSVFDFKALETAINDNSQLVEITSSKNVETDEVAPTYLAGGNNGENAVSATYKNGLELLENELVNIVVLAGQDTTDADLLTAHLKKTAEEKRERIAVIGAAKDAETSHSQNSDRLIVAAPGIKTKTVNSATGKEISVDLPAPYMAAAVAGLIASLPVQSSPTNKILAISGLTTTYNTGKLEKLVTNRALAVENKEGFRIVKGITTSTNTAWHQITTRRIVDYAMYGVRSGCNPYIGKLNNERVRGAMKATLDAFLTRMVNDEALISYELEVTATRAEQIQGIVQVTMTLRPAFSIDFIKVNMYLG